jgi:hypothetical protein
MKESLFHRPSFLVMEYIQLAFRPDCEHFGHDRNIEITSSFNTEILDLYRRLRVLPYCMLWTQ